MNDPSTKFTSAPSELTRALLKARNSDLDFASALSDVRRHSVETVAEARLIVELLAKLPRESRRDGVISELSTLLALFQGVKSDEAQEELRTTGLPELCRIYDELSSSSRELFADDLMFVLKILAMYRSPEGTERVIAALSTPVSPDSSMWSIVLHQYNEEHPDTLKLLQALPDRLPAGFLRFSLLDCANSYAISRGPGAFQHPFDTVEGKQQLLEWLTDDESEEDHHAFSAATSLPFISNPERDRLLERALEHRQVDVRMEAAWASAKLGHQTGLAMLSQYCRDPRYSLTACRYLEELGHDEMIPAETKEPAFEARSRFANWLAHPNELGRAPDEVEVVDHRVLAWPPDGERKPLWLVKFRVHDPKGLEPEQTDCGLVGSVTFCLFTYKLLQRPPEDGYAIHCYWEKQFEGLIDAIDAQQTTEAPEIPLEQWGGPKLENPVALTRAVLAPALRYPQSTVTLVSATLQGSPGWAVLDGPRSQWYPQSEMPKDVPPRTVLMVHVGRRLLGFTTEPNRKQFLTAATGVKQSDSIGSPR